MRLFIGGLFVQNAVSSAFEEYINLTTNKIVNVTKVNNMLCITPFAQVLQKERKRKHGDESGEESMEEEEEAATEKPTKRSQ